jgi:hypothetical protein
VTGDLHATKIYGDISNSTGFPAGDNLGNHTATAGLNMANNQIMNVSSLTITGPAFSIGGSTLVVANGNVGVGLTAPLGKFHVYAADADNLIVTGHVNIGDGPAIKAMDSSGANYKGLELLSAELRIGGTNGLIFRTAGTGGSTEAMRITNNGNVGVGTTTPSKKLEVVGDASFSSNTSTVTFSGLVDIGLQIVLAQGQGTAIAATCPSGKYVMSCMGGHAGCPNFNISYYDNQSCYITCTSSAYLYAKAICARVKGF